MNKKSNLFVYVFLAIGIVMLSITSTLAFLMDVDKGESIMKFGKVSIYADGKGSDVDENIKSMLHAELVNDSFGRDDAIVTEENQLQVALTADSADSFIKVRFSYTTTDENINAQFADTLAAMTNSGVPAGLNLFEDNTRAYKYYTHTDGWSYLVYDNAETEEVEKTLKVASAGEVFVITADYKLTYDTVVTEQEVIDMFEVVQDAEDVEVHLVCEVKAIQAEGAREADVLAAEGETTLLGAAEAAYGNATIYDFVRIELENDGIVNKEIEDVTNPDGAVLPAEGAVKMAGNRIVLTDMIAGEGIEFDFEVTNPADAEKQVRLGVICENDGGLMPYLHISIDGVKTKGFNAYSEFITGGKNFNIKIESVYEPVVEEPEEPVEPEEGEGEEPVLAAATEEVADVKTAELILVVEAVEPEKAVAQNIIQVATAMEWQAMAVNINNFSGKTIELVADLDFADEEGEKGEVNPIVLESGNNVVINGKGHTIKNYKVSNGAMKPLNHVIGGGSSCFYRAGLVASNAGTMVIKNLTLEGARIQITETKIDEHGSSQVGVVVGYNAGNLTLTNVNVKDSEALGYNKLGALVGHNYKTGKLTVNRCTVSNTTMEFDDLYTYENARTYPEYVEGSFAGALAGYNQGQIVLNGLKVEQFNVNIDNIDGSKTAGAWTVREFEGYEGVYGTIVTDSTHYMYMLYSKLGCQACEAVEMVIGNNTYALEEIAIPVTRIENDFMYNN